MAGGEDSPETKQQHPHKQSDTTLKYDQAPSADRRSALDKME